MTLGRLHVLTDFHFQQRVGHADLARQALAGGAEVIQFRQKEGTTRSRLYEAKRAAAVCRRAAALYLVDDDVDIALAVGAGGVHLGQDDMPVDVARRVLGDEAIIGATASTATEAEDAARAGASYIGFGPVFPTGSKSNPKPVRGLRGLAEACRAVDIPVIAIAGITPQRVAAVLETGAHGVAVMTAITTSRDVTGATRDFRQAIDRAIGA